MSTVKERIALLNAGKRAASPPAVSSSISTTPAKLPPTSYVEQPQPAPALLKPTPPSPPARATIEPAALSVAEKIALLKAGNTAAPTTSSCASLSPLVINPEPPAVFHVPIAQSPALNTSSVPSQLPSLASTPGATPIKDGSVAEKIAALKYLDHSAQSPLPDASHNSSTLPTPPSSERRLSGQMADKIAALQSSKSSKEKIASSETRPAPNKLVLPSTLVKQENADQTCSNPEPRASHRPSAAMMKLQGGINIQALMGGGMGARPSFSAHHEEEEEDDEGCGSPRLSFTGRGSFGARSSLTAASIEADRNSALSENLHDDLTHAALSRPTMEKRRPAAKKNVFVVDDE